jgi:hypothetical protein
MEPVTGQEHGPAPVGEVPQQPAHPGDALGVQAVRRLVQDQRLGPTDECLRDPEALPHPERVIAHASVGRLGQPSMSTTTMNRPVSAAEPAPLEAPTGIPFAGLLRVEWGKATDTRAARWLLALVALSTIGLMLRPLLAHDVEQSFTSYLGFAGAGVTIMLPVVAILTLTSEWSQRTVLTTFTQEPLRIRVVLAKVAVSVLLGAAGALFGLLVTVAALAVAAGMGRHADVDPSVGLILGFALFVLPMTFVLTGHAVAFVQEWIDSTTTFNWVLLGEPGGHWPQITAATLLWVVAPLTAGLVRTVRREIT